MKDACCDSYEWRVISLMRESSLSSPHVNVLSAHGHAADDTKLLSSEVLAVLRTMMAWSWREGPKGHCVFPVSLWLARFTTHARPPSLSAPPPPGPLRHHPISRAKKLPPFLARNSHFQKDRLCEVSADV
jgi:hypothetical protein